MDKNSLSHTVWNCKYHVVFAPKYTMIESTDFRHGYQHKTITCTAPQVLSLVRGGWLLELKKESGKQEFYQVKNKTVHFASREKPDTKVTMNAVELNWL